MAWKLNLINPETDRPLGKQVGDCWYQPRYDEEVYKNNLWSNEYKAYRAGGGTRLPLVIKLPGRDDWCIDFKPANEGGNGWHVTGEPPEISCSPSIMTREYHGWVQNGYLTDDTDGRRYDEKGNLIR